MKEAQLRQLVDFFIENGDLHHLDNISRDGDPLQLVAEKFDISLLDASLAYLVAGALQTLIEDELLLGGDGSEAAKLSLEDIAESVSDSGI